MIDVFASQPQYVDHLAPVAAALGDDAQMLLTSAPLVELARARGCANARIGVPRRPEGQPVLVASYKDADHTSTARRLALIEHGAGQSYLDAENPRAYPGGPGWERASLILTPGPHATEQWARAYPFLRVAEVGSPKLDRYFLGGEVHGALDRPLDADPTVAFTFHWPCKQSNETWPAFDDWLEAIGRIAAHPDRLPLLGHWHPRWGDRLAKWYRGRGIEPVASLAEVMDRADVLVADSTSAMYEFAATGRQVVALNAARWRKGEHHGLRFWDHVPGVQLDPTGDQEAALRSAIRAALEHDWVGEQHRARAVARVYGDTLDGRSTERAVTAIREWA